MTIKILRKGKIPKEQTYITQCKHCKCLFEYQNSDTMTLRGISESYMSCDKFYLNCPTCNRCIEVDV